MTCGGPSDVTRATYKNLMRIGGQPVPLNVRINPRARRIIVKVRRLTIRDGASRWGSCSSNGALSFSWRLVMAPPFVLDYVAAHEVAHLREMNNGPRFWRLVERMVGDSTAAQDWLRENGSQLHRYGDLGSGHAAEAAL